MWLTPDLTGGTNQLVAVPDEKVDRLRRLGMPMKQVVDDGEVETLLRTHQLAEDAVIAHIVSYATDPKNWQRYYQQNQPWTPVEWILSKYQMLVDPVKLREAELEIDRRNAERLALEAGEDALKPEFRQVVPAKRMKRVMMPVGDGISGFELREVEIPDE